MRQGEPVLIDGADGRTVLAAPAEPLARTVWRRSPPSAALVHARCSPMPRPHSRSASAPKAWWRSTCRTAGGPAAAGAGRSDRRSRQSARRPLHGAAHRAAAAYGRGGEARQARRAAARPRRHRARPRRGARGRERRAAGAALPAAAIAAYGENRRRTQAVTHARCRWPGPRRARSTPSAHPTAGRNISPS